MFAQDELGCADNELRQVSCVRVVKQIQKVSGWDSASTGHLVCLVQACVKGLYLYLYLYLTGDGEVDTLLQATR